MLREPACILRTNPRVYRLSTDKCDEKKVDENSEQGFRTRVHSFHV